MRRLLPLAILAASIALAACSSGASTPGAAAPTEAAPGESASPAPPSAVPPSAVPSESAAASAEPSMDAGVFGSEYAKIQSDLQAEIAKITAGMMTATTPEQLKAVYQQYADAMRKSIAASRAIDWPAPISGDMDKLLADQDQLVGLWEQMMNDPTATANQDKIAALEAEMTTLAQKVAGYFGVTVP